MVFGGQAIRGPFVLGSGGMILIRLIAFHSGLYIFLCVSEESVMWSVIVMCGFGGPQTAGFMTILLAAAIPSLLVRFSLPLTVFCCEFLGFGNPIHLVYVMFLCDASIITFYSRGDRNCTYQCIHS